MHMTKPFLIRQLMRYRPLAGLTNTPEQDQWHLEENDVNAKIETMTHAWKCDVRILQQTEIDFEECFLCSFKLKRCNPKFGSNAPEINSVSHALKGDEVRF